VTIVTRDDDDDAARVDRDTEIDGTAITSDGTNTHGLIAGDRRTHGPATGDRPRDHAGVAVGGSQSKGGRRAAGR
jgi:hypothetical protein